MGRVRPTRLGWAAMVLWATTAVALGQIPAPPDTGDIPDLTDLPGLDEIPDIDEILSRPTRPLHMEKPFDLPLGGVRMALPAAFRRQPAQEEFQVLIATRVSGAKATASASLMAIPVASDMTAKEFSKGLLAPMRESITLRHLEVVSETEGKVAGATASLRAMRYTHRGIATAAHSAVVIRDVPQPRGKRPLRLAYLLTMEVAGENEAELDKSFPAVLKSVEWIEFARPLQAKTDFAGEFLKEWQEGYAIRQPVGWIGTRNEIGLVLAAIDYLDGGVPSPFVQVLGVDLAEDLTAADAGRKAIEAERKDGLVKLEIVSEGAAEMAGQKGHQFVLRRTQIVDPASRPATAPAKQPNGRQAIEVMRVIVAKAPDSDTLRSYALLVIAYDADAKAVSEVAEKLAEGVSLFQPAVLPVTAPKPDIALPEDGPVTIPGVGTPAVPSTPAPMPSVPPATAPAPVVPGERPPVVVPLN